MFRRMRKFHLWPLVFLAAAGSGAGGQAPALPKGLDAGQPAPAFAVAATNGKTIKLSDYKGKRTVVLAFFPKVFTGG